jgi:hypothetical protein
VKLPRPLILHPFLFGVYPVIALLAYNVEEIHINEAFRALIFSLLGATALFLLARLVLREWHRAAFATTLFLGLFFSYGHVYNFLEPITLMGMQIGRHRLLIPIWLGLSLLGLWWVTRKGRNFQSFTRSLNLIAAIALIFPVAQLGLFGFRYIETTSQVSASAGEAPQLSLPQSQPAPDIYYIILDGYSRDDMLAKFYDLDNKPFLDQLAGMGFYVARCAQSNYAQTQLSLGSSLNYNYLDTLDARYRAGNTSRVGLADFIQHSAVRRALESLGYYTVAFATGFDATQITDAKQYLSPRQEIGTNDFENLFLRTTAARVLMEGVAFLNVKPDWEARDQAHREQVLFTLSALRQMPELPGPKFVFAHIVIPHWPHVFGPNGEPVHVHPDSVTGYRNQVIFINKEILPILSEIIAKSANPPVIVIQGDHGAIIESPKIRMPILNAYYLPDGDQKLYASISPVNSFRLILDHYFGADLPFLQDTSYYSIYADPYNYQIVPNERPGCQNQ